eukprot:TRINITY_DN34711_c0_g1_i1.p1 TRINITY_DN34711_c0_g1~~TRINITY_DN34711_c0_g1_i1.p1  ORF type:complete len:114 (+),score=7.23 TRINITY_DN34711_c0_g1_i1:38-343(+)
MALETRYFTFLVHLGLWGSIAFFVVFVAAYNTQFTIMPSFYHLAWDLSQNPAAYLVFAVCVVACLLPDFTAKSWRRINKPHDFEIIIERSRIHKPTWDEMP